MDVQETNAGNTVYVTDAATGIMVERFEGTGGVVRWNEYLYAPGSGSGAGSGKLVGEHFTRSDQSNYLRYLVSDHLGSVAVVTDEQGNV